MMEGCKHHDVILLNHSPILLKSLSALFVSVFHVIASISFWGGINERTGPFSGILQPLHGCSQLCTVLLLFCM